MEGERASYICLSTADEEKSGQFTASEAAADFAASFAKWICGRLHRDIVT
jgi:hypothetical protein